MRFRVRNPGEEIDEKIAQVSAQLASGEARLVFDPTAQTTNIVMARDLGSDS